uniref:NEDD8-activating enzyme E1 regulatory subunit n=1 Tax=Aureoumbra lagunensis TaxID=44058 RepID=A0A7S3K4B3_9STRA|mmetsp:Transcript_15929/g.23908  ORF Transcript_15929/g.23908 Transcript_15929/m.23908 type:complete len:497 (+) Transcript_15929:48-1538(+)
MATNNKYDRQLRLWGAEGQANLANAHVALIGASATGSELLKNVVLPGIGKFTIYDNKKISQVDVENNFFVRKDDLVKDRAQIVCELVSCLNPEVKGEYYTSIDKFFEKKDDISSRYTLIICADTPPEICLKFADYCCIKNIPFIAVRSYGFIGSIRLQYKNHEIYDSKPDAIFWDLRISDPFPELEALVPENLDNLPDNEHSRVPYVILLIMALRKAQAVNQFPKVPKTLKEKEFVKSKLLEMRRYPYEENFQEALDNCYRIWSGNDLPEDTINALAHIQQESQENRSVLSRCLISISKFMAKENRAPISGAIPDMHSDTTSFIALQRAYHTAAQRDLKIIASFLINDQDALSILPNITKNLRNIRIISTPEYKHFDPQAIFDEIIDFSSLAPELWSLALYGADLFYAQFSRWPCNYSQDFEPLLSLLPTQIHEPFRTQITTELIRAAGSSLHTTAAVIGGIASQEAIKIIANQFVPLNHSFIFDGIHGAAAVINV